MNASEPETPDAHFDDADEIARAWADEAERRYEELRTGAVRGIPAEEVFARLRAQIG